MRLSLGLLTLIRRLTKATAPLVKKKRGRDRLSLLFSCLFDCQSPGQTSVTRGYISLFLATREHLLCSAAAAARLPARDARVASEYHQHKYLAVRASKRRSASLSLPPANVSSSPRAHDRGKRLPMMHEERMDARGFRGRDTHSLQLKCKKRRRDRQTERDTCFGKRVFSCCTACQPDVCFAPLLLRRLPFSHPKRSSRG